MEQKELERKALLVGAIVYIVMGLCGWVAFYLSHSSALLLDGNYNLVNGLASLAGYVIVKIKDRRTATFPFGQFVYESLYSLIKGIFVLGILVASLWENAVKMIAYVSTGARHEINSKPIAIYAVAMVSLSLGLAAYYRSRNKRTGDRSSMLKTDSRTATMDGILTLVAGGGLLLALFIGRTINSLGFLQYIGDAMIVIIFVAIAVKEPIHIIRHSFIELAGGSLQSESDREAINGIIGRMKPDKLELGDIFMNKTGSSYLVVIYVRTDRIDTGTLLGFRNEVQEEMGRTYPNSQVEILIS